MNLSNNKSIVYWASPHEVPALNNTKDNMITNNLVKTKLVVDEILDNIDPGDKVAVKVHVGEAHDTRYLRHDYVREVVMAIKSKGGSPTLIETQGIGNRINRIDISDDYFICIGHRKNEMDHLKIANLHGYNESLVGAPLKFIDGPNGLQYKKVPVDGIQLKEVAVASGLFDYDKLVIISRFKGHAQCAFGGALKQLGIGCVSKIAKHFAHFEGSLVINKSKCDPSKCNQECIEACPLNSIEIKKDIAKLSLNRAVKSLLLEDLEKSKELESRNYLFSRMVYKEELLPSRAIAELGLVEGVESFISSDCFFSDFLTKIRKEFIKDLNKKEPK